MKSLKISVVIAIIVIAFSCSGLVAALSQDQGAARALFTTSATSEVLQAGQPVTGSIFFSSTASDSLVVTAVSLHFDWMPTGQVVGYQLTAPFTVDSNSSHLFDPMQVQIPLTIDSGTHTYYIGIDGTENGVPFSWDSPTLNVDVAGNVTATPSNTNSGGQPGGQTNLLLYGATAAVVVIIAILIIVFMMRKKRTQPKSTTKQGTSQPETSSPEKKPNPEQDFNI